MPFLLSPEDGDMRFLLDETQGVISNGLHVLRRLSLGAALRVEDHIAAMRFLTFEMLDMEHTCCQKRDSRVHDFGSESYSIFEDETVVQPFDTWLEEFEQELYARAANISSQPNGFVESRDNYWRKRISIEIGKFNNTSNSEPNLRRAEELGVV
ncbi:hypothetical protein MAC_04057 [Metarhizium acridum CQMa 102]|uniref:Uncharacterized protein n=1 Tax=Metarhizium acridum (strain CQMa 102) TaxID=655827 RepID=E9E2F9_METAQ|nr:uncharacterized protein MAC_04057 [Metarhizium acridum CQMa 102]EFY89848.1 hypothetical protein MAC_04057 [Metarhizium acridum CQMa 102]